MKRVIIVLVCAFASTWVFAQQDQKAKEILDTVTKKTQSYKSIEADFSFEMENASSHVKEKNKGSIILKAEKYKVVLPGLGVEVYCDGKNVWTYMKDANEVSISPLSSEKSELMDPSKVFTMYQQGFNYKFIEETAKNGKNAYVIDLLPQTKDISYSNIRLNIDKEKLFIVGAQMKGKDGNIYTVSVDQLKTDKVYDDSFFMFDAKKYPGIEVVDNR